MPHPQTQPQPRAARRHHAARTKRRVRRDFHWLSDTSAASIGMAARTPCACSCEMCTSHKKQPDRQRMRANAAAKSELAQLWVAQPRFDIYPDSDALTFLIHEEYASYIYDSEWLDYRVDDPDYQDLLDQHRQRYALAIDVVTRRAPSSRIAPCAG